MGFGVNILVPQDKVVELAGGWSMAVAVGVAVAVARAVAVYVTVVVAVAVDVAVALAVAVGFLSMVLLSGFRTRLEI